MLFFISGHIFFIKIITKYNTQKRGKKRHKDCENIWLPDVTHPTTLKAAWKYLAKNIRSLYFNRIVYRQETAAKTQDDLEERPWTAGKITEPPQVKKNSIPDG